MKTIDLQPDEYLGEDGLAYCKTVTPREYAVLKVGISPSTVNVVKRLMKKPNTSANYRSGKPRLKNTAVTARWESILGTVLLKRL